MAAHSRCNQMAHKLITLLIFVAHIVSTRQPELNNTAKLPYANIGKRKIETFSKCTGVHTPVCKADSDGKIDDSSCAYEYCCNSSKWDDNVLEAPRTILVIVNGRALSDAQLGKFSHEHFYGDFQMNVTVYHLLKHKYGFVPCVYDPGTHSVPDNRGCYSGGERQNYLLYDEIMLKSNMTYTERNITIKNFDNIIEFLNGTLICDMKMLLEGWLSESGPELDKKETPLLPDPLNSTQKSYPKDGLQWWVILSIVIVILVFIVIILIIAYYRYNNRRITNTPSYNASFSSTVDESADSEPRYSHPSTASDQSRGLIQCKTKNNHPLSFRKTIVDNDTVRS